jgi:hypothetical protein
MKLHSLHRDLEKSMDALAVRCFDYPQTSGTIGSIIDWFKEEAQTLPITFAYGNKNISYFIVAGILKMLAGVGCEHISELWKLAVLSDASLLPEILEDIGKIAGKLVRRWWMNHGLPYWMQHLKEENQVSFISKPVV